jgi:hypothetical protein
MSCWEQDFAMNWFERLTGCEEHSPEGVRAQLEVDGSLLRSRQKGRSWIFGELETPSLAELRERVSRLSASKSGCAVREVAADVRHLHADKSNANALFQVASQFNLLEMVSPEVTPEHGVGIYEQDLTQGPACAIAAGAGTIYRNYFAPVNGRPGQSADNQIDCLAGIGVLMGNTNQRLWQMVNGYALPTPLGLSEVNRALEVMGEAGRDRVRQALQIGLQWNTQVTLDGCSHLVSQAYCSAMPVSYTSYSQKIWEPFARLILEAAYEAVFCAAVLNRERSGCGTLFLTLLGGGAFRNRPEWILDAIQRAVSLYGIHGLNVAINRF